MSTRMSIIYMDNGKITLHLYQELHDDLYHLEIRTGQSNSSVNAIVTNDMAQQLTELWNEHPRNRDDK